MASWCKLNILMSHTGSCRRWHECVVKNLCSVALKHRIKRKDHVFTNISRWKSKRELADYLLDNMLLNKDGLIILNKPYGVGIHQLGEDYAPKNRRNANLQTYVLSDVLPYIGNALGENNLIIAKSAEKYSSGVSILVTSEKVADQIQKCRRRDQSLKKLSSKYLGVAVGQSSEIQKRESVKVALTVSPDGKTTQPIIYDSKRPATAKDVKTMNVAYRTVSTGNGSSLIEISCSSTKWHFLRVYLAHKLIPLLGDNIHGCRVRTHSGHTLGVNPFNVQNRLQKLDSNIMMRLGLDEGEESIVPCHLHLQEVTLTKFNEDLSDVTVVAPTPSFFDWTCQSLNLLIKE